MGLLTIDKNKCKNDGICAMECPIGIIQMDKATKLPVISDSSERACINCGHCVAVCPYGALSLASMSSEKCLDILDEKYDANQIELLLKARRSIRVYKDKIVDRNLIEKVIDVARYAPSGINRQPVNWIVIYDSKKVQHLAGLVIEWMDKLVKEKSPMALALRMQNNIDAWKKQDDRICRKAPHLVIAYGLKDDAMAPQSATIALEYFEIAAKSLGLGTCWAGYVNMAINMYPPANEFVGLPKRGIALGSMMIGWAKFKYFKIPLRKSPNISWKD